MNRREALQTAVAAAIGSFLPKWVRPAKAAPKPELPAPGYARVYVPRMTTSMPVRGSVRRGDVLFADSRGFVSKDSSGTPVGVAMADSRLDYAIVPVVVSSEF